MTKTEHTTLFLVCAALNGGLKDRLATSLEPMIEL